jgi:hypothetical protein
MDYRTYMNRIQDALERVKAADKIQSMAGGRSKRVK